METKEKGEMTESGIKRRRGEGKEGKLFGRAWERERQSRERRLFPPLCRGYQPARAERARFDFEWLRKLTPARRALTRWGN